jgi:hypothetical protein
MTMPESVPNNPQRKTFERGVQDGQSSRDRKPPEGESLRQRYKDGYMVAASGGNAPPSGKEAHLQYKVVVVTDSTVIDRIRSNPLLKGNSDQERLPYSEERTGSDILIAVTLRQCRRSRGIGFALGFLQEIEL